MPLEQQKNDVSEPVEGDTESFPLSMSSNYSSSIATLGSEVSSTFQRPVQHPLSSQLYSKDSTSELQQESFQQHVSMDNLTMNHHALYLKALKFSQIGAQLHNKDIWEEFSKVGTEMVITKKGRRMFPTIKASVYNLEPNTYYFVILDFIRADEDRYKYVRGKWVSVGKGNLQLSNRIFLHPNSPASGARWMEEPIDFNKIKLTNNIRNREGNIILSSMHKYIARVHIIEGSDITLLPWSKFAIFLLQETSFIAVTAYQNPSIVSLKIEKNPFARAFLPPQRSEKRFLQINEFPDECSSPFGDCSERKRIKVADANSTDISRQPIHISKTIKPGLTSVIAIPLDMPLAIDTTLSNTVWRRNNSIPLQCNGQIPFPQDYNYLQSLYSMNHSGPPVFPSTYDKGIFPMPPDYYYNSKHLLIADVPYRCVERFCNNPNCIAFGKPVDQFNSPSEMYPHIKLNPFYSQNEGSHNFLQNETITKNNS